ncbi:MAG TPA: hypothetical protein VH684_28785 [Xanthobacteraceae bacterium]|jgi:hypothetical protein
MRYFLAAFTLAFAIDAQLAAHAERRTFIIANNPDGYGIDRCLATGASCGVAVASAYCRSRDFSTAASFRKIDRHDITPADVTASDACPRGACDALVAIECTR